MNLGNISILRRLGEALIEFDNLSPIEKSELVQEGLKLREKGVYEGACALMGLAIHIQEQMGPVVVHQPGVGVN